MLNPPKLISKEDRHLDNHGDDFLILRCNRHLVSLLTLFVLPLGMTWAQDDDPSVAVKQPAMFILRAGEPIAYLAGLWRFQAGDNPAYSDPNFDDSQWQLLDSTKPWSSQGFKTINGFAWYRFQIVLPAGKKANSLLLPEIRTSYQCFVDGKLVHSTTSFPPRAYLTYYPYPVAIDLPQLPRSHQETLSIALRVWDSPIEASYLGGGPNDSKSNPVARFGRPAEVHRFLRFYTQRARHMFSDRLDLAGLTLLACAISLALYILRRSEREYLWFGFATLANTLDQLIAYFGYGQIRNETLFNFLSMVLTIAAQLAFVAFYQRLLSGKTTWFLRIAIVCLFIHPVALMLAYCGQIGFGMENLIAATALLPFECWLILLLIHRSRQKVIDARLLLIPVSLAVGVKLMRTSTLAFRQLGHPLAFNVSEPLFTNPIAVTIADLSECFFLLAMLAILIHRFSRSCGERDRIASELEAARTLQHVLIPDCMPSIPGLSIATAYFPAQEVGGDFYQIFPLSSGETVVVLGDVSGKGLNAAMTVSMIVGAVRTLVEINDSPASILAGLNRQLCERNWGFTTCLALRISANGFLTVANAGHLLPYRNGIELSLDHALPLGVAPGAAYSEFTARLMPGDRLTLLTDGVPEAARARELFGFARTQELSTQSARAIADAARSFGQTDDITVLSLDFEFLTPAILLSNRSESLPGQPLAMEAI